MTKYHINSKGVPGPCSATKGNCPYGGADSHYDSPEAAQAAADKRLESEFGIIGVSQESGEFLGQNGGPIFNSDELDSYTLNQYIANKFPREEFENEVYLKHYELNEREDGKLELSSMAFYSEVNFKSDEDPGWWGHDNEGERDPEVIEFNNEFKNKPVFESEEEAEEFVDEYHAKLNEPPVPKEGFDENARETLATSSVSDVLVNLDSRGHFKTASDEKRYKYLNNGILGYDLNKIIYSPEIKSDEEVKMEIRKAILFRTKVGEKRLDQAVDNVMALRKVSTTTNSQEEAMGKLEDHYVEKAFNKPKVKNAIKALKKNATDDDIKRIQNLTTSNFAAYDLVDKEKMFMHEKDLIYMTKDEAIKEKKIRDASHEILKSMYEDRMLRFGLENGKVGGDYNRIWGKIKNKIKSEFE